MCLASPPPSPIFIRQWRQLSFALFLILVSCFLPGGLLPRRIYARSYVSHLREALDVVSGTSPRTILPGGPRTIDQIHAAGLHHRGSLLFAIDDGQRVLLLWRSRAAVTCPSTWSLVGEHVRTRESFEAAAQRGVDEEVPFLGEVDVRPLGQPALVENVFATRLGRRVDRQWTRYFLVTSSFFSVDFREIMKGAPAQLRAQTEKGRLPEVPENVENTQMLGMSIVEVVRLAGKSKTFLCDETQRLWLLRAVSVLGVVLVEEHAHVREVWEKFKRDGDPVFCNRSEDGKSGGSIDLRKCGIPYGERGRDVQFVGGTEEPTSKPPSTAA